MRSSDIITAFIMEMLESEGGELELKRNELAQHFNVVPSQINYVISSRFTPEMGYLIESKRGGGGYIRIRRVSRTPAAGIMHIINNIGDSLNSFDSQALLKSMEDNGYITDKTRNLMLAAASDTAYSSIPPSLRDKLRASVVKNMLLSLVVK
ncbi:MAG: CtsR family transcriptional regulator [Clostridiales bacterium]|nr:CtsR family transcriptional regulator [Clostridiales bacterium]